MPSGSISPGDRAEILAENLANTFTMHRKLELALNGLVILNVLAVILESYAYLKLTYQLFFYWFEVISVAIFTAEYAFRVGSSLARGNCLSYVLSFGGIIDLLAIIPFYLPRILPLDLRFVRILRLTRLLRLLKLKQYNRSLRILGSVFIEKHIELRITLLVTFLLLLFASVLMFYVEGDDQPEAFPNIPATFWWAVATLTTVGYGDIYPVTGVGRFLSGLIALMGIGVVALPTGILSAALMDKLSASSDNDDGIRCPHCGHPPPHTTK